MLTLLVEATASTGCLFSLRQQNKGNGSTQESKGQNQEDTQMSFYSCYPSKTSRFILSNVLSSTTAWRLREDHHPVKVPGWISLSHYERLKQTTALLL